MASRWSWLWGSLLWLGAQASVAVPARAVPAKLSRADTLQTLPSDPLQQGEWLFFQGQFPAARSVYQQALRQAQQAGDRPAAAAAYLGLGQVLLNLGDYGTALAALTQARSQYAALSDPAGLAATLNQIGVVQRRLGNVPTAYTLHQQALALAATSPSSQSVQIRAEALHNLAAVQAHRGHYTQALSLYKQALAARQAMAQAAPAEIGSYFHAGRTFNNLGGVYDRLGNHPQALVHYQQALTIARHIGNRASEGRLLNNIGRLYRQQGKYRAAQAIYQQALTVLQPLGDRASLSQVLTSLGLIAENLGEYETALNYYQQGQTLANALGDRRQLGYLSDSLGGLYYRQGRYGEALSAYQQTLAQHQAIGFRAGEVAARVNLAGVYEALGRYPEALRHLEAALPSANEQQGAILGAIGALHERAGNLPQALMAYQRSLAAAQATGSLAATGEAWDRLGGLYQQLGQLDAAQMALQRALDLATLTGDRGAEGRTLNSLALLLARQGETDQAQVLLSQARGLLQALGDRAGEAIVLSNGAQLLAAEQPFLAIALYKQSVNLRQDIRSDLLGLSPVLQQSYTDTVAQTYRQLADLLLQQDRVLEAQQVLDLLQQAEASRYLRSPNVAAEIALQPPEQAILASYGELQRSAVELGQELNQLRQIPDTQRSPVQQQRLSQLVQLQDDLNQQFNQFIATPAVTTALAQLSRSAQRASVHPADLDALRDNLQQLDGALLYPLVLEDRLELVLTLPESPPLRRTVSVSRTALNQAVLDFRQALAQPGTDAIAPAQQLYDWLIRPIAADLAQSPVTTLVYAPDGPLRYIPLAALHDGQQWLVQDYIINVITAQSLTEFNTAPVPQPQLLAGAFADPALSYDVALGTRSADFSGLPFAGQEVRQLQTLWPQSRILIDQAFSLAEVRPRLGDYDILHFATHAAFLPGQPEASFILFGNGDRATLQDISSWSLQADLVVLSACETGLGGFGNGEEILGLGYQFQRRGAQAVLASLWQVNDSSTQQLMTAFYQQLQSGQSKAAALRTAQLSLINGSTLATTDISRNVQIRPESTTRDRHSEALAHPFYWAPFILIGNGL
ncbi:CHAT domain-containing protein [Sphaerothrix gracilis]|uniref:CHAT domain-containing protein n=1 Tax=Sphaerothrix gracilis TaxID=3151835 RepID=UPI0031FC2D3D